MNQAYDSWLEVLDYSPKSWKYEYFSHTFLSFLFRRHWFINLGHIDCYHVQFVWFLKHTLAVHTRKIRFLFIYVHLKKDSHLGQHKCEYHFCVEYPFTFWQYVTTWFCLFQESYAYIYIVGHHHTTLSIKRLITGKRTTGTVRVTATSTATRTHMMSVSRGSTLL